MRKLVLLTIAVAVATTSFAAEVIHRENIPAPGSLHCRMDTWMLVYFSRNWTPEDIFPKGGWIVQLEVFKREGPIEDWGVKLGHLGTFATFDQAAAFLRQAHAIAHGDETDCQTRRNQ